MAAPRTYTDADRVSTLAALELNGGNLSKTVRQTGIPIATISLWRNAALSANPERALKPAEVVKTDWADLYGRAAQLGAEILTENLERYRGTELGPNDLRNVAIVAGIAVDKHLDYRDGRKANTVVDQSQHLTLPPGTTLADIQQLEAQLRGNG